METAHAGGTDAGGMETCDLARLGGEPGGAPRFDRGACFAHPTRPVAPFGRVGGPRRPLRRSRPGAATGRGLGMTGRILVLSIYGACRTGFPARRAGQPARCFS